MVESPSVEIDAWNSRTISLPPSGRGGLGADLNFSESRRAPPPRACARLQPAFCPVWVKRVTSVRSRRPRNVRYASNTDRIDASQQNVALCQSRPNASQKKNRYSITSSGRASSGSGTVRLSPQLEPAVAAELHIKRGADGNYDSE